MQVLKSSQFLEQVNISPQNLENGDFLGGPVAKNLPSNAGDMGSIPGQGTKIPQASQQGQVKWNSMHTPMSTSSPYAALVGMQAFISSRHDAT